MPRGTIIKRLNDKDISKGKCNDNIKGYCEQKHKSPDCINEYYKIKLVVEKKIKEAFNIKSIIEYEKDLNTTFLKLNKNTKADVNLVSFVRVQFNNKPDTIYIHSQQQYPVEFICLIGGVILLWTGFSVSSIYAYGKKFVGKQNKIEQMDQANVTANNYYHSHNHTHKNFVFINNKINDKISSIKKLRKIVKRKKNCVISQVNIDQDN